MENNSPASVAAFHDVSVGGNLTVEIKQIFSENQQTKLLVDLYNLPKPTTALIGRKIELAQLIEAINNPQKRLAIIIAAGGIGKSALTDEWLQYISQENYFGKTRVFGWSFYSQGSHNTFTNSQPFFSAVLPFLGIHEIPKDEVEKARVLAKFLQQHPCLLILDGLEPLQYSQNLTTMNGELQDIALKEFIACFRQMAGKSFVLLSSRQPLVELKKWQVDHYLSLDLKTLPDEDGADLLQALGVIGKVEERQKISQELNGHALSLVLVGHLLSEHHQGDCRYVKELPPLTSAHNDGDAEKDSRHALRVLDYYNSLQDAASRCFLQLLGLFDRPMNATEKSVLITNANHAEPLRNLTEKQWQSLEKQLEKSGLLLGKKGSFGRLEWDTHPIIRTYFGVNFKNNSLEEFKQAHLVLFNYYKKLPEKKLPDTFKEMIPLFQAMVHGCLAEEYRQALFEVFDSRIQRSNEFYSSYCLGAYPNIISILSYFDWENLTQYRLNNTEQIWILKTISHCFIALGFFQKSIDVSLISLKISAENKYWAQASSIARILANSYQSLGQLDLAMDIASQAIEHARHSKDYLEQALNLSRFAHILQLNGNLFHAKKYYEKAEKLLQEEGFSYLITISGFKYCGMLLDSITNKTGLNEIIKRGEYITQKQTTQLNVGVSSTLDFGLGNLVIARTYFALNDFANAESHFKVAIQTIKKAFRLEYIPQAYLNRANFYLVTNQLEKAKDDLYSAWSDIERCNMKFFAIDYLLIHGRYSLHSSISDVDTALNHYEEAKNLIAETGYNLRDAELDLLAAQICRQRGNIDGKDANFYLLKAKKRIEEIGQWGLMPHWTKEANCQVSINQTLPRTRQ